MPRLGPLARGARARLRLGRALERTAFGGLLLLLVWLPLPFGSHRPWAELLLVLGTSLLLTLWALSWALSSVRLKHLDAGLPWLLLLWGAWLLWTLCQTQPWSPEVLAEWAPTRWQQLQDAARVSGIVLPPRPALSLDAALTRHQLLLSLGYAQLFLLAVLTLRRRRFKWLLWCLFLSGLAQALYGSIMVLSGLEYGAWGAKQAYQGFATGSFVNRNHFAGYLELCLAAALGVIIAGSQRRRRTESWRQRLRRWLALLQDGPLFARVGMALLFVGLILSQSRMGNAAAVGGLTLTGLAYVLCRPRGHALRWTMLLGSVLLIDIFLLGRWFNLEQLAERYAGEPLSANLRFVVLEDLQRMIPAYMPLGSGLGTFGLAYPQFRSPAVEGLFDHAHNDYAQFLIESGYIGVTLLGLLVLSTVGRALLILRRRGDPRARGVACAALSAIAALAIHSLADFNLQIAANAATLLVLMAAVWACPVRSRHPLMTADG